MHHFDHDHHHMWNHHHGPNHEFKGFNTEFKKQHDRMKEFFLLKNPHMHPKFGKHPFCHHHFPHMPFHHMPKYPFSDKPDHFFNDIKTPQIPVVFGNDQKEIKSMIIRIDFGSEDETLRQMRRKFVEYHERWMMHLGGVLGGFKGMMPHVKRGKKKRNFRRWGMFPRLMNRLIRLHEMIVRHKALKEMLVQNHQNPRKIQLLEKKLKFMEEKYKLLRMKLAFLKEKKGKFVMIQKYPDVVKMLQRINYFHDENSIDFDKLQAQILRKKQAYLKNLESMQKTLDQHDKMFVSIEKMTDQLPLLFSYFQKFVEKFKQKMDEQGEDNTTPETTDTDSEETFIENDHTIEEDVISESSKNQDEESQSTDEKTEEIEEIEEVEEDEDSASEPTTIDNKNDKEKEEVKEETADEIADALEGKIQELDDGFDAMSWSDQMLDRLREMQKDFELKMKEQNEHVKGLKEIDEGLVDSGKSRDLLAGKLGDLMESEAVKKAGEKVESLLADIKKEFNAQED